MAKPEPLPPLRTTVALSTFLPGIDSLCSLTSFLFSSLMWNLRCAADSVERTPSQKDSLPIIFME
jgi:hypothetical protein